MIFTEDVVDAVAHHMNTDHEDDNVLIVRALGGESGAESARVTGLDATGVIFAVAVDGGQRTVCVPWNNVPEDRGAIRLQFVWMYQEACARLGIEPRPPEQHGPR